MKKIRMKIGKDYIVESVTEEQIQTLVDSDVNGKRFIQLGLKNWNIDKIDYWYAVEEETNDSPPPKAPLPYYRKESHFE